MRVIATQECIVTPDLVAAWGPLDPRWQDVGCPDFTSGSAGTALLDLGKTRIAAMDEAGIDVKVLSLTTPGV